MASNGFMLNLAKTLKKMATAKKAPKKPTKKPNKYEEKIKINPTTFEKAIDAMLKPKPKTK